MNADTFSEYLRENLAKNNLTLIFETLTKCICEDDTNTENFISEVTTLSARYHGLNEKTRQRTIEDHSAEVELNRLRSAIQDVIKTYQPQAPPQLNEEIPFNKFRYSKLDDKTFFQEIDANISGLIIEIQKFNQSIRSRKPSYGWIEEFTQSIDKIKSKWDERRFQVAVMALMKSGKSTLLNSWIGDEYLASAAKPETMRLIRIRHNSQKVVGVLSQAGKELARGVDGIRSKIKTLNKVSREGSSEEEELILEVNIAALSNRDLSGYGFDLLDTPGTNEAGVSRLQAQVERVAKFADVIIYLLDFTKLKSIDEERMLGYLKSWKEEIFDNFKNRIFFVINKMDAANRHDSMGTEETRKYVKSIIKEATGFEIDSGNIILISAENALLARLIASGKAKEDQIDDFKEIAFGVYGKTKKTLEDCQEYAPELLAGSGFAELEKKTLNVIYQKRSQILLSSILDDLDNQIKQAQNKIMVGKETLLKDKEHVESLRLQIQQIQQDINDLILETDNFKKKANEIVNKQLQTLEDIVKDQIRLSFSILPDANPLFPILEQVTNFFRMTEYELKSTDRRTLQNRVNQVHRQITNFIEYQFEVTWQNIVDKLYHEYLVLNREIEKKSKPIILRIENAINETFQISLNPLPSQYESVNIENFYYETQPQLNELINQKRKSNMNVLQSFFNSILNIFGLGVREEFYDEFMITSTQYRKNMLDSFETLMNSAKDAGQYLIEEKYSKTLEDAKTGLKHYSGSYSNIIQAGIQEKQDHLENIPELLTMFSQDLSQTQLIIERVDQNRNYLSARS